MRNLLKRRLKEIIRQNNLAKSNRNYILQAKKGASTLSYSELENQLKKLFSKDEIS